MALGSGFRGFCWGLGFWVIARGFWVKGLGCRM